jgi:hypothetical protein
LSIRGFQVDGAWSEVTIRELVSHTAGFTDYPKDIDLRKDYREEELLKIVEAIPPAYPPRTAGLIAFWGM